MALSFSNTIPETTLAPGYRLLVDDQEGTPKPEYFTEARDMFTWLLDHPALITKVQAIQFREGETWITAHQDYEIRSVLATRFKEGFNV